MTFEYYDKIKPDLIKKAEHMYAKLVDCLEKCLIYGHIRRFAD